MSNLQSAKFAIEAELEHARQGLAFYQTRVEALEAALGQLENVDGPPQGAKRSNAEQGKRSGRGKAATAPRVKGAKEAGGEQALPATGRDFWAGLVGSDPQSSSEIFAAAVKSLGITPTAEQEKKLAQRQANALSILTRDGVLSSSGSGRARRYSK